MDAKEDILSKMNALIAVSCDFKGRPIKKFQQFHKALLKFFFNAIDVNIDYDKSMISIWNSKPLTENPVRLFDLNEAIADWVGYTDLEETLSGCLEKGKLQQNFYTKLLLEYGTEYLQKDEDVLSA